MDVTYLTAFHNLNFDFNKDVELRDGFQITTNKDVIAGLIPEDLIFAIGGLELGFLLSGCPVIFQKAKVKSMDDIKAELVSFLFEAGAFISSIWMLKDNSVNKELGFAIYHDGIQYDVHSNFINRAYSTAAGETITTVLSEKEIVTVTEYFNKTFKGAKDYYERPDTWIEKGLSDRLTRAFIFLQTARSEHDLSLKVAHYCSAFESLFSSSAAELSTVMLN